MHRSNLIGKDPLKFAQKADSGELWVAILERAFAEIRGGYKNIEKGFPEEGFALLMNKAPEDFNRINFDDLDQITKLKQSYNDLTLSNEEAITKKMMESLGSKMSLSTPSESELIGAGATKTNGTSPNGDNKVFIYWNNTNPQPTDSPDLILYAEHAYSIQSGSNGNFTIRNPHGGSSSDADYAKETEFTLTGAQIVQYFDAVIII